MGKRYERNPGADQIQAWKAAIAAQHKRQRQQRGRYIGRSATPNVSAGMMRRSPGGHPGDSDGDHDDSDHDDGPWHD
jgi:hypothetical protein